MQMEVEISKFDTVSDGQKTPEKIFEEFLLKYVIEPFGCRIPVFLNDLFLEMNFSNSIMQNLKDSKKLKKRNQSAQKMFVDERSVFNLGDYKTPGSSRK